MKILVQEDSSIPNVALYIFYKVGSRNERPGTTGLSHFFEHMMFNGAKKYGPKQFDEIMEAAGGSNNAYTSNDVTVYQNWFPKSALETIFDLEADRIRDLAFDGKMIESEREVVASERRRSVESNNVRLLSEQLNATAFIAHPYQWPVLGWMSDIESWTSADLKHHFEIGYAPANATMVIVGDVKADQVFALAKKYIEPIPSRSLPPKVATREPVQLGERRIVVRKFGQLPILMFGYHAPEATHPDYYPLQLLQTILFEGESSRIHRRLVDKEQTSISVRSSYSPSLDPTLFEITVRPREGIDLQSIEKALYEEINRVQNATVDDQELGKARNILLADFYREMKTINGKASALGDYEVLFGDFRKLFTAADEYQKVTKQDLQRVARQYLTETNRTVATLIPVKEEAK